MADFSFTATARCEKCGKYLSSSTEECSHDGKAVDKHLFRTIGGGRDTLVGVQTTAYWKWFKLKDKVGDDWIKYEYIGTKESVVNRLNGVTLETVDEMPKLSMSLDAPSGVDEH